jgi:hypothetical protein
MDICPIKGVSEDCKECPQIGWGHCVYWKVHVARKVPSKSSPYKPLTKEEKVSK